MTSAAFEEGCNFGPKNALVFNMRRARSDAPYRLLRKCTSWVGDDNGPSPDAALDDGYIAARCTYRISLPNQGNWGGRGVKIFTLKPSGAALPATTDI